MHLVVNRKCTLVDVGSLGFLLRIAFSLHCLCESISLPFGRFHVLPAPSSASVAQLVKLLYPMWTLTALKPLT